MYHRMHTEPSGKTKNKIGKSSKPNLGIKLLRANDWKLEE